MKRLLTAAIVAWMMPMIMFGQTYSGLWKQVAEAQRNDLPQTEQEVLRKIADKALQEQEYGQLLKANLQEACAKCRVSPDSLAPAVDRLKAQAAEAQDEVLRAVYHTVLGYIYQENRVLDEQHKQLSRDYYSQALARPDLLAAAKAGQYVPLLKDGTDSRIFGDDMLSVIGYEARRFDLLSSYYHKAGNRRAALLTALELLRSQRPEERVQLNKAAYLQRIDSLIRAYADLPEAGEAAIERYNYMDGYTDATAEQKMQYINEALSRWGSWQRMNALRNKQRDLTALCFEANIEKKVNIPDRTQTVRLENLRGVTELTMRLYRVDVDGDTRLVAGRSDDYKKLKPLLTPMAELTQTHTYMGKAAYEVFEDSMVLPGLPVGVYMVEIESAPTTQTSRQLYFVSDVRVMAQPLPGGKTRYVAVNATTGQPVKGAQLRLMHRLSYNKDKVLASTSTDSKGEYVYTLKDESVDKVLVTTASDKACPPMSVYGRYAFFDDERTHSSVAIYTDREIYRPGQTVQVAAILYKTEQGYQRQVEKGKLLRIQLRDANYQVIGDQPAQTDSLGTCSARFTLPAQGLSGSYSVVVDGQSHYFRVEEYKRPAFEVEIPAVSQNYEDGDTLLVKGRALTYAGVPVQGARVRYKVVRRRAFWWMSYSSYWNQGMIGTGSDDEQLLEAETMTAGDGTFEVEMPMILPKTRYPMFYNFVVTADVTDQAGETHQGQLSLPLGNRKTAFSVTIPDKVLAERETRMAFHQQNAAGVDLDAQVRYRFDNTGKWQEARSNSLITIPKLKSGLHTLNAICENDTLEQTFTVFSLDDKRPVAETDDWFFISDTQFPYDGTPVTVQVGSSDKYVHIVYAVYSGNKVIESGSTDRSNELVNRKFNYQSDYGNGLMISFAWMKEGKVYRHDATIRRPLPDMNLKLQWQTFRNRLTPGQQEEWTLTVTDADGKPVSAQLMATLYDKSLDQLAAHDWSLYPNTWLPLPRTEWQFATWGGLAFSGYRHQGNLGYSSLNFRTFDHEIYPSAYIYRIMSRSVGGRMLRKSVQANVAYEEDGVLAEVPVMMMKADADTSDSKEEAADEDAGGQQAQSSEAKVQLRENLNETAFFYPQLMADSEGRVVLKFTLPESLTTWRFLGVAHTADMKHGTLSDEAVARKEVMIQPNMPRFLRVGDEARISARIFNTGEKALSGTARLQLLDAETGQEVYARSLPVSLPADTTVAVTFEVVCRNFQPSLLTAKVSVSGRGFSDGEQHYLSVLPNREHVTVTVPFTQNGPGTKTVDLKQLIPDNATQQKLTVEYTNNPAWLMIQALPAVGHPLDDCALCQAASLYANTIGSHIIAQNPNARSVFEKWSRETGTETSLMSSLSKDQELKDLLLSETPWVVDADREQEQKQRLADFFDANLMGQRLASALDKLRKLQGGDGAWSWWPGMRGSWYMTVEISEMLVRLNDMGCPVANATAMLDRSFKYMGHEIVKMVDEMKKQEKKGVKQTFPSHSVLQWLYMCVLDGRELPSSVNEANTYLKNLLKKETRNQSIFDKAMSAIVLDNRTYIKSLKEYTVYREDMGRYYDTPRALYSWRDYRIPTQVAAIEAIKRLTPDDTQTIDEMLRWLLQEKRTQAWDTPVNSVDAVYAFLNGRSDVLAPQEKTVLKVDGKALDTSTATAGLGYVKTAMTGAGRQTFTAEKTSAGTSWGALYAQFLQPTSDIADHQSGIKVTREYRVGNRPASDTAVRCAVGERVTVRITIEADRNYDFVQVIDRRAACLEPVKQLSGYAWGYYCTPKDFTTNYYFDLLPKGKHVIETEYYVDRAGTYETGTCTASCAYAPEFRGTTKSQTIEVK